jgi:hypothetical protein
VPLRAERAFWKRATSSSVSTGVAGFVMSRGECSLNDGDVGTQIL